MTNRRLLLVVMALWLLSCVIFFSVYLKERAERSNLEATLVAAQSTIATQAKLADTLVHHRTQNISDTTAIPPTHYPSADPTPSPTSPPTNITLSELALYGIESRVSALSKVVGLSDPQRERLRAKYQEEALAKKKGLIARTESLEDIIGEENSAFYRTQLEAAYEKSHAQELDRDVYYTSRKLQFNQQQESIYRELLDQVEQKVKEKFGAMRASTEFQNDPSFRVRITIQENEFRSQWLDQQLKGSLSPEQYQAYLREEADSSAAELGVWHAP